MLKTIQIVVLLQGLFLLFVLIKSRNNYKRVNFWLVLACILSVMLYAFGDDDFNLFVESADWYFFHDALFITFFLLLVRYHNSGKKNFNRKDYLFFIPYLLYVFLQFLDESTFLERNLFLKIGASAVGITFLFYLFYISYHIVKNKKEKWMLYFIIPYTLISLADRASILITESYDSFPFLESYGIIGLTAFLLYILLFKLITSPKSVLPKPEIVKYKTSSLHERHFEMHKEKLIQLFSQEKLFKEKKLTVNDVAKSMNIPRQHLSEVLNVHMKTNFQDLLNKYRVEEFIACINDVKYKNYTLFGIANEVGFSSKSSFNTVFKKLIGITPSEFKRQQEAS